ncbi:SPX domain-containing protein [Flammula alnicola]|nr:SPX domain-containing protein [Flammula alnicola]
MHFSKTYSQLLLSLPPDLRDNAIQYRQLKKIINQIVTELSSLGLRPALLHELIEASDDHTNLTEAHRLEEPSADTSNEGEGGDHSSGSLIKLSSPRAVYELNSSSGRIEPQLRIWLGVPSPEVTLPHSEDLPKTYGRPETPEDEDENGFSATTASAINGHTTLLWALQQRHFGEDVPGNEALEQVDSSPSQNADASVQLFDPLSNDSSHTISGYAAGQEIVIPLVHDTEFYNMLSMMLEAISEHLTTIHSDFVKSLESLSRTIADSAHPASVAARFHPFSGISADAGAVRVRTGDLKSDLYSWREIFQIYVETEVFESVEEATRGERTVEESEKRLQQFAERVTQHGLGDRRKFKLKQSIEALETFLSLNLFILNIKKFSHANSEATRKILKKHAKRTALFFPGLQPGTSAAEGTPAPLLALVAANTTPFSLPRILVQAIGETLLPIIPSVEDYSCLICTSIAFKPIRLSCGHLFCVRCLVKMQKRQSEKCPMCRAPSVLVANRSNVDWALLNFMQDWFPLESKEKLKSNEKEASEEELREMGIDPNESCCAM